MTASSLRRSPATHRRSSRSWLTIPASSGHKGKIKASVSNAKAYLALVEREGSFAKFLWSFVGGEPKKNKPKSLKQVPTTWPESDALSKALQKAGFKFVGSTICYAFMQASGMVDDHVVGCQSPQSLQIRSKS